MRLRTNFRPRLCLLLALCVAGSAELSAKEPATAKAELHVEGLGWLHNRDQRLSLERLLGAQRGATLDANAIEDAAFLLFSAVESEGYLKPTMEIAVTREDGTALRFPFDTTLAVPLPRPLAAKKLTFEVKPGVRYVVTEVKITGLTALPVETARGYFMPGRALLVVGSAQAYTPSRLRRALESVREELLQRGFAEAQARATEVKIDDKTGKVVLALEVNEGPRW